MSSGKVDLFTPGWVHLFFPLEADPMNTPKDESIMITLVTSRGAETMTVPNNSQAHRDLAAAGWTQTLRRDEPSVQMTQEDILHMIRCRCSPSFWGRTYELNRALIDSMVAQGIVRWAGSRLYIPPTNQWTGADQIIEGQGVRS